MTEKKRRISVKAGMPPGSLVRIGAKETETTRLHVFNYNAEQVEEAFINKPSEIRQYLEREGTVTWLNVTGLNSLDVIEEIGNIFNIHPLVLEDILNQEQRPKFEDYEHFNFLTLRKIDLVNPQHELAYDQISILFGKNFVLSLHEPEHELFDAIRKRLLNGMSRARPRTPDFLVYLLSDSIVDAYFAVSEILADNLEDIEDKLMLTGGDKNTMNKLQMLRRNMAMLLKSIYPLREGLSRLEHRDNLFISDETLIFFRDIYDHTVHVIESIENQRDILSGTMDVYLTNQNNRLNSVMKVLTVISTIFIPLSFLASVYGMNFRNFPELDWKYGYLYFWIVCLLAIAAMVIYFRRKKWM